MKTIQTTATATGGELTVRVPLPTDRPLPPGEYKVVIVIDETSHKPKKPISKGPVDVLKSATGLIW